MELQCKKKGCQKGYGHRIRDLQVLESFVQQYPDKTQAEMAELWPGMVSRRIISRMLKKIDFTRKKRPLGIKKGMDKRDKHSQD